MKLSKKLDDPNLRKLWERDIINSLTAVVTQLQLGNNEYQEYEKFLKAEMLILLLKDFELDINPSSVLEKEIALVLKAMQLNSFSEELEVQKQTLYLLKKMRRG